MADKKKDTGAQTFSFDTVAVLVATILENNGSLGMKQFERMSALDGTRGKDGFNHQFRAVKKRAQELIDQAKEGGETSTAVKKTKAPAKKKEGDEGAGGKKRARKPKKDEEAGEEEEGGESPSKKVKAEPEQDGEAGTPGDEEDEMAF